jgi:putative flippase GtrA
MIQETTTLWTIIKSNLGQFFAMCFGLLAPIQPILLLVFGFIIADTVAGIWCSKKTGIKITSRRLSAFIAKMLVYSAVVILTYGLDKLLLGEFLLHIVSINLLATKVAAMALIFAEVYSIDEKLIRVTGKGIWHYFKRLIGLAKMIKKEAKDLKDEE